MFLRHAVWILIGLVGASARADGPDPSRLVGKDAFLYAEVSRPEALFDRVLSERVGRLLKAVPGYDKLLDRPELGHVKAVVEVVTTQLGTSPEKAARDLLGGGVVLAVEGEKAPERVFLIVSPRDLGFLEKAHDKLRDLARQDAATKGNPDPVKESEHRGVKIYSVGPTEAHAIVDGKLLVANGPETLKMLIGRAKGDAFATIADDEGWKARRAARDPEGLAWAQARVDRLRANDPRMFGGSEGKPPAATFLFANWAEAVRKADWATLGLSWTDNRLAAELTVSTPHGGYSETLRKFLPPKGDAAPRPVKVPGMIASGGAWRDLAAIWDVRADLLPPESVQGLSQLDTQAGTFFGGRDFGTGVLGALGPKLRVVVADQDFSSMKPTPDLKYPAVALILDLKPEDEEFAVRLKSAFQSFIGLANLGAAQSKAPPLMLGTETVDGVAISTAKFLAPKAPAPGPVDPRFNFTPSAMQVGDQFVISSGLGLAKDLVSALKEPRKATESTLLIDADGAALARLFEKNRERLVSQNMLEKGNPRARAEGEVGLFLDLLKYLGRGTLSAEDRADSVRVKAEFSLDAK